jgi:hypothetical protein
MHIRQTILFLVLAALLVPGAARAQQLILETEAGAESLQSCDSLHNLKTCSTIHFSGETALKVGGTLELDGEPYLLEWMGPGYYLESGVILQPLGEDKAGLAGQRWVEVSPKEGRIHTSRTWDDADRNKTLSAEDALTLDFDGPVKVLDVRLHLRVAPVSEQR